MRRRRWMFGKASSSHAPSASRRLLGSPSLLTAIGRSFSQNNMPSVASDSSRVLLTMIDKASDGRGDLRQRIGLAFE